MNDPASILAIDDSPGSLALVVRILTGEGYEVRAADSGELALASLEHARPDLIILDVHLQGIDGFEVCRRLQARPDFRDIPVILISAFLDPREWQTGLESGAVDFITKPFSGTELVTRVKTHLRVVRTLEDLREKEQQYRNLADSGLALIWRSGQDKKCHYFNGPWLRFTGRTLEQEMGDGWAEGVHPDDLKHCLATYVQAFDRRNPFEMKYRLKHHSGDYRWIRDMGTPNYDSQGRFLGYIGHCFDITDAMKYEESLQRNDRLDSLGLLAGGIAHDFNNLLAGLFAFLSLAKNDVAGNPEASRHIDKALGAFQRAKDLTRQLLTFAKGGDPIKMTGNLGPRIIESASFALSGSSVACEYHIASDLPPCDFDANQISQVIDNLIINALQAMTDDGKITISARKEYLREEQSPGLLGGDYIRISVADTGSGIPADLLPRIYDPFFTTKPNGNGLGLPTCYSILQKHRGGIEVESEVGVGTTFHLFLPVSEGTPASEVQVSTTVHQGSGLFIVMDDEDLLRDLVCECLGSLGYTTEAFSDGAQVVTALGPWKAEGRVPVGALLDLTVPGGRGGKDIVPDLAQAFPGLRIFATSGYSEDPVMAHPQGFGFAGSLRKPFLKEDLVALLNRHLGPSP